MTPTLAELEKELRSDPKLRRFYELAREYQKLGRLDEAAALCEKGLALQPTRWQARILLAQIYLTKDRLNEARFQVERVLLPLPENVPANHLAAEIYFALGEKEKALRHYRVVELFEPGRAGVTERIDALAAEEETAPAPEPEAEEFQEPESLPGEEVSFESLDQPEAILTPLPTSPEPPTVVSEKPFVSHEPSSLVPDGESLLAGEVIGEVPAEAPAAEVTVEQEDETEGLAGAIEPLESPEESWDQEDASFEMEILADEEALTEAPLPADLEVGAATAETALITEDTSDQSTEEMDSALIPQTPGLPLFSTVTLAELYEKQGYPEKAVEVYQRILLTDPDNVAAREKVGRLLQRMAGETPESPPVHQEDVQKALRQRRVTHLQNWLRRVREARHV